MNDKTSTSPAMAFILEYFQKNGDSEYAAVADAAQKAGYKIYPIMYGRAKSLLGLITDENRSRRRRKPREDNDPYMSGGDASASSLRQGSKTSVSEATAAQLSSFLERYRELETDRNRYRAALLQVEKMLKQVLEATM